ncbi:dihydroxyacetone kinase [Desulfoplanes formicivorans]|uniref:Dihydroxyacetone kinase n=2 Tax=Desulfoplanes formicivorans TaxID=1592317 RepID=A0A194AFM3_9BACT|nr:dihydroxyacetone kinase [Desulfoplanes formicivorans]
MEAALGKIKYLNGVRLQRAIVAGADWVVAMQKHLDAINVFPVPDGDTGSNMAATMKSIAERAKENIDKSLNRVSNALADSALMGAKGNSGAILAQFFQGLAEGLKDHRKVTTERFGQAVHVAAQRAQEAISSPKEGTILTVIREWSDRVRENCKKTTDFDELLRDSLDWAQKALDRTPEQLASLKKAGVVDAGAQGFVYMLEGIVTFMEKGDLAASRQNAQKQASANLPLIGEDFFDDHENSPFRYCTECLVVGQGIDIRKLRTDLEGLGDSLIVAGSSTKAKVHIHTNHPADIFKIVAREGEFREQKIDDMEQQNHDAHRSDKARVAIVTDTGCDIPQDLCEKYNIHFIHHSLVFGDNETYLDKQGIHRDDFYARLCDFKTPIKTSQPTPSQFKRMYSFLLKYYDACVSIHLPPAHSGTIHGARRIASGYNDKVSIVDSTCNSMAMGLVVLEAAKAAAQGMSQQEVVQVAEKAASKARAFFCFDTLKYHLRGGRLSNSAGKLASILQLRPIITFKEDGTVKLDGVGFSRHGVRKKTWAKARKAAMGKKNLQFVVAHANNPQLAAWFVQNIRKTFDTDDIPVVEASYTLVSHAGPGAAGIGFIGD